MNYSRTDLFLVDVDGTLISGTLAEGDVTQLVEPVVNLIDDANSRGATVVLLSNHPVPEDLWELTRSNRRLSRSISGCVATPQPKLLTAQLLLERLGIPHGAALLLDDDPANVSEFMQHGITATSMPQLAQEQIGRQPRTDPASRRKRNAMRRLALDLFTRSHDPVLPAKTLAYLAERQFAVSVSRCESGSLRRVAELFARTNQLHFNPSFFRTKDAGEIEAELQRSIANGHDIVVVSLGIGGIQLGVQGAAIVRSTGEASEIVNATLSCSVLPFGVVENIFVKRLLALNGKLPVKVRITETPYNARVRAVLSACGADFSSGNGVFAAIPELTSDERRFVHESTALGGHTEDGVPPVTTFFDTHIMPLIAELRGGRLLQLGYGYGEMLGEGRQRAIDAVAKKQGTEMVCSDLEPSAPAVVRLDAQSMPTVPDASVDMVFALELVEHVDRPADVFREIVRVLRPGGHLFLSAPSIAYPYHPFAEDRYRYTGSFLRELAGTGFRIQVVEDQKLGDSAVRTILLAQRATEAEKRGVAEWFDSARRTPLLDGLLLYDSAPRSLMSASGAVADKFRKTHRNDTINLIGFGLALIGFGITVERIHNASITQLLSTGVSMVADEELYEQGLELLPQVQHAWLDYYDEMVARIILAKLCQSRVSDIHLDGAFLFAPRKAFGDQWTASVLENVKFRNCDFTNLGLRDVEFTMTTEMDHCRLRNLTGSGVALRGKLSATKIADSKFNGLYAYSLFVSGGEITDTQMLGDPGTFNNALFEGVVLRNVTFSSCDFQYAIFVNCVFDGVSFLNCNLSDATIVDPVERRIIMDEDTARKTAGTDAISFVRRHRGAALSKVATP